MWCDVQWLGIDTIKNYSHILFGEMWLRHGLYLWLRFHEFDAAAVDILFLCDVKVIVSAKLQ